MQQQQQQNEPAQPAPIRVAQEPQALIPGLDAKKQDIDAVALDRDMFPQQGSTPRKSAPLPPPPAEAVEKPLPPPATHDVGPPKKQADAPKRTEAQQHPADDLKQSRSENQNDDAGRYPNPDLVLIFSLPKPDAPREEWQAAEQEYTRLKKSLKQAGLLAIAKPGARGKNERLILVRAVQSVVRAEAQNEK